MTARRPPLPTSAPKASRSSVPLGMGAYLIDRWHGQPEAKHRGCRYQVKVRDQATGKWVSRSFPVGELTAAKAWAKAAVHRVALGEAAKIAVGGTLRQPVVSTLEALGRHLTMLRERDRNQRHIAEIERVVRRAVKEAGIENLAAPDCAAKAAAWVDGLPALAPLSRLKIRRCLIAVGRTAMRWYQQLTRDPFLALRGEGAPIPVPPTYSLAEAALLVSDQALATEMGRCAALALYTGLRLREATWLSWDRVDLDRANLVILPPTQAEREAGYAVKRNKARSVPLQPELMTMMKAWSDAAGTPTAGFLFPSLQAHTERRVGQLFAAHLASLSIARPAPERPDKARTFHSLRHTHACLALAAGEDGLRLRLYLGHAGEVMTAHYAQAAMRLRSQLAGWAGTWQLRTWIPSSQTMTTTTITAG